MPKDPPFRAQVIPCRHTTQDPSCFFLSHLPLAHLEGNAVRSYGNSLLLLKICFEGFFFLLIVT